MGTQTNRSMFTTDQYDQDIAAATCDPQELFNTTPAFSISALDSQVFGSHSTHAITRTPPNSTRPPSLIMESSSDYSDFSSSPGLASSFDSSASSYIGSSRRSSAYTFPSSPCPSERAIAVSGLDSEPWTTVSQRGTDTSLYGTNANVSIGAQHPAYLGHPQWQLPIEQSSSLDHSTYCMSGEIKVEAPLSHQGHHGSYTWMNSQSLPMNDTPFSYQYGLNNSFLTGSSPPQTRRPSRQRKQSSVRQPRRNRTAKSSTSAEVYRFDGEKVPVARLDPKQHQCQKGCTQRFAREEHRKRHERKHLPPAEKQLWLCPLKECTKSWSGEGISDRRDNLTQHITKTHGTWTNKRKGHTNRRYSMKEILEDAEHPECHMKWLDYLGKDPSCDVKAEIRKSADKSRWSHLLNNSMEWNTRENKKTGHASMTGFWKLLGWTLEESLHIRVVDIAPEYNGDSKDTLDVIHPMWKAMRRGELTITQCMNLWDPETNPGQGMEPEDVRKTNYFLQFKTLDGYVGSS